MKKLAGITLLLISSTVWADATLPPLNMAQKLKISAALGKLVKIGGEYYLVETQKNLDPFSKDKSTVSRTTLSELEAISLSNPKEKISAAQLRERAQTSGQAVETVFSASEKECPLWMGEAGLTHSKDKVFIDQTKGKLADGSYFVLLLNQTEYAEKKNVFDERPAELRLLKENGKGRYFGWIDLGRDLNPCSVAIGDFDGRPGDEAAVFWVSLGASSYATGVSLIDFSGAVAEAKGADPIEFRKKIDALE